MINSSSNPEVGQPREGNKPPEPITPVEGRFQNMRERFNATATQLRDRLQGLRYKSTDVDLNPEISEFNDQTGDLLKLNDVTARRLGIDFRSTVDAARASHPIIDQGIQRVAEGAAKAKDAIIPL